MSKAGLAVAPLALIRSLAQLLSVHDGLPEERAKTNAIAVSEFGHCPTWKCAICGRRPFDVPKVVAAHITPLEEGGPTTADNLLSLCEGASHVSTVLAKLLDWHSEGGGNKSLSFGRAVATALGLETAVIGCHKLLDSGLIPRATVRAICKERERWGTFGAIRAAALDTALDKLNTEFSPSTARRRTIARLEGTLGDLAERSQDWYDRCREIISAARRLASAGFFAKARRYEQQLQDVLETANSEISAKSQSVFFYERALLAMVRQPNPDLHLANCFLQRSCDLADKAKHISGWAMSRLEWVHARTFVEPKITPNLYAKLIVEQDKCIDILGGSHEERSTDEIRWMVNALMHRAQLQFKAGRMGDASDTLGRVRAFRDELTASNGWGQFQAVHLNTIEGAILARKGEVDRSLKLLARALIPMRSARGKRPEGYKDLAECAAWVLERLGKNQHAKRVHAIARMMVDGRSGFWAA